MTIAYIKGSHNVIADALSCSPIIDPKDLQKDKVVTLLPNNMWLPDSDYASIARVITVEDPLL